MPQLHNFFSGEQRRQSHGGAIFVEPIKKRGFLLAMAKRKANMISLPEFVPSIRYTGAKRDGYQAHQMTDMTRLLRDAQAAQELGETHLEVYQGSKWGSFLHSKKANTFRAFLHEPELRLLASDIFNESCYHSLSEIVHTRMSHRFWFEVSLFVTPEVMLDFLGDRYLFDLLRCVHPDVWARHLQEEKVPEKFAQVVADILEALKNEFVAPDLVMLSTEVRAIDRKNAYGALVDVREKKLELRLECYYDCVINCAEETRFRAHVKDILARFPNLLLNPRPREGSTRSLLGCCDCSQLGACPHLRDDRSSIKYLQWSSLPLGGVLPSGGILPPGAPQAPLIPAPGGFDCPPREVVGVVPPPGILPLIGTDRGVVGGVPPQGFPPLDDPELFTACFLGSSMYLPLVQVEHKAQHTELLRTLHARMVESRLRNGWSFSTEIDDDISRHLVRNDQILRTAHALLAALAGHLGKATLVSPLCEKSPEFVYLRDALTRLESLADASQLRAWTCMRKVKKVEQTFILVGAPTEHWSPLKEENPPDMLFCIVGEPKIPDPDHLMYQQLLGVQQELRIMHSLKPPLVGGVPPPKTPLPTPPKPTLTPSCSRLQNRTW